MCPRKRSNEKNNEVDNLVKEIKEQDNYNQLFTEGDALSSFRSNTES